MRTMEQCLEWLDKRYVPTVEIQRLDWEVNAWRVEVRDSLGGCRQSKGEGVSVEEAFSNAIDDFERENKELLSARRSGRGSAHL